jgi:hypothetical protein
MLNIKIRNIENKFLIQKNLEFFKVPVRARAAVIQYSSHTNPGCRQLNEAENMGQSAIVSDIG